MQENAALTARLVSADSQLTAAANEQRVQRDTIVRLMNDQQNVAQLNIDMDNLRLV